ncbi:MAG TPA: hypothetical protein VNO52_09375 [Methylomirabilota bacterium]|nr:hypothetical protein [Methylomirabilota bacterium]
MRRRALQSKTADSAHRLGAGLMLSLWLVTLAFATVPELHHVLHCDSHQPSHECCLSLIGKGECLTGPVAAVLAPADSAANRLPPSVDLFPRPAADLRLAPGRAPPAEPLSVAIKG